MALSGSVSTQGVTEYNRSVTLNWTATQDVANNRSTISWKLVGSGGTSGYVQVSEIRITINGSQVYYRGTSTHTNCYYGTELCSGTTYIDHNADGTKSFGITVEAGIYQWAINCSGSGTFALDTIPRASQPTVSNASIGMGGTITIYTNRASSSFTHDIWYVVGSEWTIVSRNVGASCTWTIPMTLANKVPNSLALSVTIVCRTYSGNTSVGDKSTTMTATVPSSVVPSINSITCTDPTGYLSTYGGYVQGKSTLKVVVGASGCYSSTITSFKITANGTTYNSNSPTTGVLATSGTNTISVTVTDSRGRTATSSTTISVLAYSNPTIATLSLIRCNSSGTADENGAYMKAVFKATITALNNHNGKTITLQYKKKSDSAWTTAETYSSYSVDTNKVMSADTESSYDVKLSASDNFTTSIKQVDVGTVFTLMDFRSNGKGISIGKVSESDEFDVNMATRFRKDVRSAGDVIAYLGGSTQTSLSGLNNSLNALKTTPSSLVTVVTVSGTTTANGYLATNYNILSYVVLYAYPTDGYGYAAVPCYVSGKLWFYVYGTEGGKTVPRSNASVSIKFFALA